MLPDLATVPHNPIMEELTDILCNRTGEHDRNFFHNVAAYFMGMASAMMRATIVEKDGNEYPVNIYALSLAQSGFSKTLAVNVMEHDVFKGFKERFKNDSFPLISEQNLWVIANKIAAYKGTDQQTEFDKVQKEWDNFGEFLFTFDSGTTPALKAIRQKLLMGSIGSINLTIDEIGSNLVSQSEILGTFLELYEQGRVKRKLVLNTETNKRSQEIDGKTPATCHLFGTPSKLFDGGPVEKEFIAFLKAGYARRFLYGFGIRNTRKDKGTTAARYKKKVDPALKAAITKWSHHFYKLADAVNWNWKMDVTDEVGELQLGYGDWCEERTELISEFDEIRQVEMLHRSSKALKIAGVFAFCEGSTTVELDHYHQAMKLVEQSGDCLEKILSREPSHCKLARYIASQGTELTHSDILDALPFYKSTQAARNEMMSLAIQWGYKRHIIIKKNFVDNIELFTGETLKETDTNKLILSYSNHWAYHYEPHLAPFDSLHLMTQADGIHWSNHQFKQEHRTEENVIAGFNMIALDVDEGCSLQAACELMKEYKFMVHTTKRHQTPGYGDRFRMLLPINYKLELNSDEYKEFMENIFAWLPFKVDDSYKKREKKSESFAGGGHFYNPEGSLLDVLDFIPKTSRNDQYRKQTQELGNLDNLEIWFSKRIQQGNRSNEMIKYALCLVDAGWALDDVRKQVHIFNKKLSNSMSEREIDSTILVTVATKYQKAA